MKPTGASGQMLKLSGAIVVVLLVIVGVFVLGHSLSDSATPGVFDGVTASDLTGAGITILDLNPTDHATLARDTATRSMLFQGGITVESSQLVRIRIAPSETIPPKLSGDFLAWAIRLDTSEAGITEYFGRGLAFSSSANPTLVFVNANTGDYLREYFVPAVLIRGNSASAAVVLDGVPPAALANDGYEASYAAADEKAAVSEAGAASAATKDSPGMVPRQTALVRLTETREPYRFKNQLVWVVNVDPTTAPAIPACGGSYPDKTCEGKAWPAAFMLIFVDAGSGKVLFSIEQGDPAGPQPVSTHADAADTSFTGSPTP